MKFVQNEKVLCFHGPLMYEAKVSPAPFVLPFLRATLKKCLQ